MKVNTVRSNGILNALARAVKTFLAERSMQTRMGLPTYQPGLQNRA